MEFTVQRLLPHPDVSARDVAIHLETKRPPEALHRVLLEEDYLRMNCWDYSKGLPSLGILK